MNTSPAPDVERVMDRMGRSAFGYRSFPNPVDDADSAPADVPAAPLFSLIGAALPEAAATPDAPAAAAVANVAVARPNPFLPGFPTLPQAVAGKASSTPLRDLFHVLSGDSGDVRASGAALGREPVFPFRRR
jgi:hypothetical protein